MFIPAPGDAWRKGGSIPTACPWGSVLAPSRSPQPHLPPLLCFCIPGAASPPSLLLIPSDGDFCHFHHFFAAFVHWGVLGCPHPSSHRMGISIISSLLLPIGVHGRAAGCPPSTHILSPVSPLCLWAGCHLGQRDAVWTCILAQPPKWCPHGWGLAPGSSGGAEYLRNVLQN